MLAEKTKSQFCLPALLNVSQRFPKVQNFRFALLTISSLAIWLRGCYTNWVDWIKRIHRNPAYGALAQLVARNVRIVEVRGSNPLCSIAKKDLRQIASSLFVCFQGHSFSISLWITTRRRPAQRSMASWKLQKPTA